MTTFEQAQAAIPKALAMVKRLGGVTREISPQPEQQGLVPERSHRRPLDVARHPEIGGNRRCEGCFPL